MTDLADAPVAPPLLLRTKLYPPARRDLVPRPALAERLATGPPRVLTVGRGRRARPRRRAPVSAL